LPDEQSPSLRLSGPDYLQPRIYLAWTDEIEYVPNAFGFLVPKKIITSFFDKQETDKRALRLTGRITYTYDAFKHFDVSADSEVPTVRN
jgi:hypothetical protein